MHCGFYITRRIHLMLNFGVEYPKSLVLLPFHEIATTFRTPVNNFYQSNSFTQYLSFQLLLSSQL